MSKTRIFKQFFISLLVISVFGGISRGNRSGYSDIGSEAVSPRISLSASAYDGYEYFPFAEFRVIRSGDLSGAHSVDYSTVDGTALASNDYLARSGRLTFNPGEFEKSVTVGIINDRIYEPTETFGVILSNPIGPDIRRETPFTATISIIDNEEPSYLGVSRSSVQEAEQGKASTALAYIWLSNPSTETVTVSYATADGTATAGSDYQATSGVVTFLPLEDSKAVPITIYGDANNNEGRETFFVNLSNPINAPIGNAQGVVTIVNHLPLRQQIDFNGNSVADLSTYDTATGNWYESTIGGPLTRFGTTSDKIVPADYTGDGRTDPAFWRPLTGFWYILRSDDNSYYAVPFGADGDIPAPADYDADGRADLAVFRPSTGVWYIQYSSSGNILISQFGLDGDKPVAADYDGDWKADIAIFRPNGTNGAEWWIKLSSNDNVIATIFGLPDDRAVPADYTGDDKADIAVWRASTKEWFILKSEDFSIEVLLIGNNGSIPAPGDYVGNGRFHPATFLHTTSGSRLWEIRTDPVNRWYTGSAVPGNIPTASAYVR